MVADLQTRNIQERQAHLEDVDQETGAALAKRRGMLDGVETITAYAQKMSNFLKTSELTERRAFIESFVKETMVQPEGELLRYTIPCRRIARWGE